MKVDWLNPECYEALLYQWKKEQIPLNKLIVIHDLKISVKTMSHRLQYFEKNKTVPPELVFPRKAKLLDITEEVLRTASIAGTSTSELMQQGYSQKKLYAAMKKYKITLPRRKIDHRASLDIKAILEAYGKQSSFAVGKQHGIGRDVVERLWKENQVKADSETPVSKTIPPEIRQLLSKPWTKTVCPHRL